MKRKVAKVSILILAAFLYFSNNTLGQSQKIWIETSNLYLGEVYELDGIVCFGLGVQNIDTLPIIITKAESKQANLSAEIIKKYLLPGEKTLVKVFFNPKETQGIYKGSISLFSNEDIVCEILANGIILEGTLKDAVRYTVGGLGMKSNQINFGFVYKGNIAKRMVPVVNLSDKEITVDLSDLPAHVAVLDLPRKLAAGETGFIELNYNSQETSYWDIDMQTIKIIVKGENTFEEQLSVVANVRENFKLLSAEELAKNPKAAFSANTYMFDTITSGELVEYPFVLENKGNRDLLIRAINPACGFAEVSPDKATIPPGETAIIKAVFDTKGLSGESKKGITVVTNDPENYKQFLWVQGYVQ